MEAAVTAGAGLQLSVVLAMDKTGLCIVCQSLAGEFHPKGISVLHVNRRFKA